MVVGLERTFLATSDESPSQAVEGEVLLAAPPAAAWLPRAVPPSQQQHLCRASLGAAAPSQLAPSPRATPVDEAPFQTLARQVGSLQDAVRDAQARSSQVASEVRRATREAGEERAQLQARIARLEEASWVKAASYEPEPAPGTFSLAMEERLRRLEERVTADELHCCGGGTCGSGSLPPPAAARLEQLESSLQAGLAGLARALRDKATIEQLGPLASRIATAEETERRVADMAEAAKAKASADQRQCQALTSQIRQLESRLSGVERIAEMSEQQAETTAERLRSLDTAVRNLVEAAAPRTDPSAPRVQGSAAAEPAPQQQQQLEGVLNAVHQVAADMRQLVSRVHWLESTTGRAEKVAAPGRPHHSAAAAMPPEQPAAFRRGVYHPL